MKKAEEWVGKGDVDVQSECTAGAYCRKCGGQEGIVCAGSWSQYR